jgi:hypothetical protein
VQTGNFSLKNRSISNNFDSEEGETGQNCEDGDRGFACLSTDGAAPGVNVTIVKYFSQKNWQKYQ